MAGRFRRKRRGRRNQRDMGALKRKKRGFVEVSDSSDEDFVLDEEEQDDDDIESTSGEEVNESDEEEEAESTEREDSEEDSDLPKPRGNLKPRQNSNRNNGRIQALKKKPRNQSTKRVEISSSDDDEDFEPDFSSTSEDDDCVDDDNEGEEFAKPQKKRKRAAKSRSSGTPKLRKRKKRTPSSKKLVQRKKKSRPVNKRSKTTTVSQKLIKSTACAGSESDEAFVVQRQRAKCQRNSFQIAETGWKCPRRGKLKSSSSKLNSGSDSEFICSKSDADYTISEEDGEPSHRPHGYTRSANRSIRALSIEKHETVPNFRGRQEKKHTHLSDSDINKDVEGLRKKGKEKVDELQNVMDSDMAKPVCGICLSDEGKAIRGQLDSCDHYFCFACIMEWAKVESRCPMCKQRFSIISKSLKSGKGLRGTAIKIPVRDQVYQPSEEEVLGFLDPYANIVCLECQEAGDDGLLLLCDLCDAAYHTYCVGLGRAVPEGDWYCQVCQTSRPAQSNTEEEEVDDFVLDLHNEDDGSNIKEIVEDTPIAERINLNLTLSPPCSSTPQRDTRTSQIRTIRRRIFRRSTPSNSPGLPDPARGQVRQTQFFGSPSQVSSAGARTLSGQRRLQERIHVLHDNWSAQERGFQQFSPGLLTGSNSGMGDGADFIAHPTLNNRSRLSRESARASNLDSPVRLENAPSKSDIDQAWTMMEESRAQVGEKAHVVDFLRAGRYCQGSSSARSKDDFPDLMGNTSPRFAISTISPTAARARTSNSQGRPGPATINSRGNSGRILEEFSFREIDKNEKSAPSVSNRISRPCLSERNDIPRNRLNSPVSFGSKPHENEVRKVEGAKDQVRDMVKTHMKQMILGKEIDKALFKEIARCSTHTILAACGIEHHRHMVQPFEGVSCCHTDRVQSSDLMAGCCTNCFNSFVKKIVGKMLVQKVGINA